MPATFRSIMQWLPMLLVLVLAMPARAEFYQEVAIVNMQRLMRDSNVAKSVMQQLESKRKSFQAELSAQESALQKEDQELMKQRSLLSPEAFEKKAVEFRKKATDIQKTMREKRMRMGKAYELATAEVLKKIQSIVQVIAQQRKLRMVIPHSELLFYDANMDITNDVMQQLNKELPDYKVTF